MPHATTISELPPDQPAGFAARHLFGAGAVDRARDVLELIETWRPDLVIHEMIEWGRRRARQPPDEITADAIAGTLAGRRLSSRRSGHAGFGGTTGRLKPVP